jgi:hypothetical protein
MPPKKGAEQAKKKKVTVEDKVCPASPSMNDILCDRMAN